MPHSEEEDGWPSQTAPAACMKKCLLLGTAAAVPCQHHMGPTKSAPVEYCCLGVPMWQGDPTGGVARAWLASHPGLHPSPWMPSGGGCRVPGYPAHCPKPTGTSPPAWRGESHRMPALESQPPFPSGRDTLHPTQWCHTQRCHTRRQLCQDIRPDGSPSLSKMCKQGEDGTNMNLHPYTFSTIPRRHVAGTQPLAWADASARAASVESRAGGTEGGVSKQPVTALGGMAGAQLLSSTSSTKGVRSAMGSGRAGAAFPALLFGPSTQGQDANSWHASKRKEALVWHGVNPLTCQLQGHAEARCSCAGAAQACAASTEVDGGSTCSQRWQS